MSRATHPLRLVLDIQGAQDIRNGDRGIGRQVAEHTRALLRIPGLVAAVLLNPALPFPGHIDPEIAHSPLLDWSTRAAMRRAQADGPVAYHLMSPFESNSPAAMALPEHALAAGIPLVVTLHDLIPLLEPERYLPGQKLRRYHQRLELIRTADLVLAVSEHTRREAVRLAGIDPARCRVIGGGASERFTPAQPGDDPGALLRTALPQVTRDIVLFVSGGDERKNTERLIRAWARLPAELRASHQLVVSCQLDPWLGRNWADRAVEAGLAPDELVLTDFVADDVLLALYRRAELVVMPSLAEGFGLPVVEAVACDRPVITSNTTSLPEILDLPESTFDPLDEAAMAASITRGLRDSAFRERLLEAGRRARPRHRWELVAQRTAAAVAELAPPRRAPEARLSRHHAGRDRRIALVGPMPPTRSGIADYNARLAAELRTRCTLDVFSQGWPAERIAHDDAGYRRFPTAALGRGVDPESYDAIVYTVGNSEHHFATYEAAMHHPGLMWFHDVRLGGFYRTYAHHRHPDDPHRYMRAVLDRLYGTRLPEQIPDAFSREMQLRHGIGLTREWVRQARGVIVNSAFAERLLRLDQGPDARIPQIWRVPFAIPAARDTGGIERFTDPPVIASFGMVDAVKGPETLIEALAEIRRRTPARLVFVGPIWDLYQRELEKLIAAHGLEGMVEFTDDVSDGEYAAWLHRATVALQLRRITNGESSAAVGDCLAAGLPVITNMINAAEEFPEGAVSVIDFDCGGHEVAVAVTELFDDEARRGRQAAAARRHAERATHAQLAEQLLEIVEEVLEDAAALHAHAPASPDPVAAVP